MIQFSIIIPTYNRSELLKSALLSVIGQTYENWEVIIVDDGGHDETAEMVNNFAEPRFLYFWKENEERGIARNYGVLKAKGDYVFFLDSDDILFPHHLELANFELNQLNHPEFFHTRYQEWYGDKKINAPKIDASTIHREITKQNKFACQFFLRRDIALEFPFLNTRKLNIGEDWLLVLKLNARFKLHGVNEYTSAIVHHGQRSMELAEPETIIRSMAYILEDLKKDEAISHSTLKNVETELTSLAALAASIHKSRKKSWRLLKRTFSLKLSFILKKRTWATLKKITVG